jgi:replication-associated recombination protein RarA
VRERSGVQLEEGQTLCKPDAYYVQHCHAVDFEVSTATEWKYWFHHQVQTFLIVDEAQDLRKAQWSRLKTIAPRKSLTVIFCTSEPETIEPSLVDRCTHVRLGPLSTRELKPMVERACALKGIPYNAAILPALNKAGVFRPRAILNVVEAVARGIPADRAVVGQSGLGA